MAAEEYGLSSPDKIHPKGRWLLQYDGRALESTPPSNNAAGRPQFGPDKAAAHTEQHNNPSGPQIKSKTDRGNTRDINQDPEDRAGRTRSMYTSRRYTPTDYDG